MLSLLIALLPSVSCAYSRHATSMTVTSPNTLKTYILYDTHSSTTYTAAQSLCSAVGKLASITPDSGDIDFLGQFINSLDHPYWLDAGSDFNTPTPCAALYSGGAVAIPKPESATKSPCDNRMNVICETR